MKTSNNPHSPTNGAAVLHTKALIQAEAQRAWREVLSSLPDVGDLIVPITVSAATFFELDPPGGNNKHSTFESWFRAETERDSASLIREVDYWIRDAINDKRLVLSEHPSGETIGIFLENSRRILNELGGPTY